MVSPASPPAAVSAVATDEIERPLEVAMVYQDPTTGRWATELWDQVKEFASDDSVRCNSWSVGQLASEPEFEAAVQAAASADVLVISVRDTGELPLFLHVWIDAWIPMRAGRDGALVALLGLPGLPDTASGHTCRYLEAVARRVGMDFLPHERRLPGRVSARGASPRSGSRATSVQRHRRRNG